MAELVADISREIARQCSVPDPVSWTLPETEEAIELKGFLQDAAEDFLDRFDFGFPPALAITYPEVTDGVVYTPGSYRVKNPAYIPEGETRPQGYNPDTPEWNEVTTGRTALRIARSWPPFVIDGNPSRPVPVEMLENEQALNILRNRVPSPPLSETYGYWKGSGIAFWNATGKTIAVLWMTNEWIAGQASGQSEPHNKAEFTEDTDTTELPRRALVAGAVGRFRRRHGMPHEALFATADDIFQRWARARSGGGPRKANIATGEVVGAGGTTINVTQMQGQGQGQFQYSNTINRVTFNPLPPPFGGIGRG